MDRLREAKKEAIDNFVATHNDLCVFRMLKAQNMRLKRERDNKKKLQFMAGQRPFDDLPDAIKSQKKVMKLNNLNTKFMRAYMNPIESSPEHRERRQKSLQSRKSRRSHVRTSPSHAIDSKTVRALPSKTVVDNDIGPMDGHSILQEKSTSHGRSTSAHTLNLDVSTEQPPNDNIVITNTLIGHKHIELVEVNLVGTAGEPIACSDLDVEVASEVSRADTVNLDDRKTEAGLHDLASKQTIRDEDIESVEVDIVDPQEEVTATVFEDEHCSMQDSDAIEDVRFTLKPTEVICIELEEELESVKQQLSKVRHTNETLRKKNLQKEKEARRYAAFTDEAIKTIEINVSQMKQLLLSAKKLADEP